MTTGFTWDDYVTSLVEREGTLAAVAEKLAAAHNFADDVASVERALHWPSRIARRARACSLVRI